ncbi:putative ethylene response sensor 1 [Silene latifolia]|uniref:putative ethylene response sensor 1 n=1 Tax=Silene latifolia TaxID=37657 RepID=UPI003D78A784
MDSSNSTNVWPADERFLALHGVLDVVMAMAYFAVPLVLIYSMRLSSGLPLKKKIVCFGIVAIFCGVNYMTNLRKYYQHLDSPLIMIVKGCYTVMALLAVIVLYFVFCLKKRELFLKNKVEELNSMQNLILRQLNTRKAYDKLIHEILSTIDEQCILKSAAVGLGKILNLEECAVWVPSRTNNTLCLSQCFKGKVPIGTTVSMSLPVLAQIFGSVKPVRIPLTCPLVKTTSICERCMSPDIVAIRVPLLHFPRSGRHDWLNTSAMRYGVMVLVLVPPSDSIVKFRDDELELLEALAEQVSVSLAHASTFEESAITHDHLRMQNSSLALAARDMEMAFRDSIVLRDGIFNQMLMVQDIIPLLSTFLSETTSTPEQRMMVETVLKSGTSMDLLMENVRDLRQVEDGSLVLRRRNFDLSATINQVVDMMKPIATVKKLLLSLTLDPNLPANAAGDQERLMRIIQNILANAVKFTKEGGISVIASVVEPRSYRAWRPRKFYMVPSKNHFYLRVQIEDSGCGVDPDEIPEIFNRFINRQHAPDQFPSSCLGLPICKRLVNIMEGDIWVESEGLDKGTTVAFIVKLWKSGRRPSIGKDQNDPDLSQKAIVGEQLE